jgi:hypothetical protein
MLKALVTLIMGALAAGVAAWLNHLVVAAVITVVVAVLVIVMLALSLTVGAVGIRRLLKR